MATTNKNGNVHWTVNVYVCVYVCFPLHSSACAFFFIRLLYFYFLFRFWTLHLTFQIGSSYVHSTLYSLCVYIYTYAINAILLWSNSSSSSKRMKLFHWIANFIVSKTVRHVLIIFAIAIGNALWFHSIEAITIIHRTFCRCKTAFDWKIDAKINLTN